MKYGYAFVSRYQYFLNKPRFEFAEDSYGNDWAAIAVESGYFQFRIGESHGEAGEGSLVLCPPQTNFHRSTSNPLSFHYFIFQWDGFELPSGKVSFQEADRTASTLKLLKQCEHVQGASAAGWRNHLLTDLLLLHNSEQTFPTMFGFGQEDAAMEEARRFIGQHFDQEITLEQIARRSGLSSVQFSRRFQRAYQIKPSEYLSVLRIQKACRLLTHTKQTISDIARQCGHNNGFYLCRVFQAKMKMSPSAYRRTHQV